MSEPWRVLVCGDRNWTDADMIERKLLAWQPIACVIEGEARGAHDNRRATYRHHSGHETVVEILGASDVYRDFRHESKHRRNRPDGDDDADRRAALCLGGSP